MDSQSKYICHWGIKGMKWGVRKNPEPEPMTYMEPVTSKERISYNNNVMKYNVLREKNRNHEAERNIDLESTRVINNEKRNNLDSIAKFINSVTSTGVFAYSRIKNKPIEPENNSNNKRKGLFSRFMSHSDSELDYICHWGIKGMKWGVRKDDYEPTTSKERTSNNNNILKINTLREQNRNHETERNIDLESTKVINKERRKNMKSVAKFINSVAITGLIVYSALRKSRRSSGKSMSHSGIKGMKWGVRRYQNEDGSLTEAGKARYKIMPDGTARKLDSREMTNDELNTSNMRLAKEEEYNRHTGNESRNAGYKKNIAEKTAAAALASFALSSATSFLMNKFGKNKLEGKELAKRTVANGLFAAGTTAIATFATATAGANAVTNTKVDEAYRQR